MTSYKVARRSFIAGLGGSAALLLPLLRNIEARAAGTPAPLRFLVIHHPLGTLLDSWRPSNNGATTTTFTLPSNSAPFNPLKSKMVMIDGLNIVAATKAKDGQAGDKTHEGGMVALMTGQATLGRIGTQDHAAGGASIDQLLLAKSPLLGGPLSLSSPECLSTMSNRCKTPFGSLQLAADIRSDRDEVAPRVMSYLDPNANQSDPSQARRPLYPETQPLNVYNRIFSGAAGGAGTKLLLQNKSVLDFMRSDLARMKKLIPASEAVKLDAQAAAIQQLEASIQGSGVLSCVQPTKPMSFDQSGHGADGSLGPSGGSNLSGVDYYDSKDPNSHPHQVLGRLQLSMIKAAFACDLVRVATFMWSAGTNWVVFPGTFNGGGKGKDPSPHHPPSHTTDQDTLNWLSKIDTFYSEQNSQAIQELDALKDVDGNSLLDNTVVAYVTEVARARDHDQRNVPFLVFGGKNTGIQGGTFLKANGGPLVNIEDGKGNRPTNDAWLALAPIFGVNLPSLGTGSQWTGPLPGLVG